MNQKHIFYIQKLTFHNAFSFNIFLLGYFFEDINTDLDLLHESVISEDLDTDLEMVMELLQ